MRNPGKLAAIVLGTIAFLFMAIDIAWADAPYKRSGNSLTLAVANGLYCKIAGCAPTGTYTWTGVTDDIDSATGEDLRLSGGGQSGAAGSLQLQSRDELIDLLDDADTVIGQICLTSSLGPGFAPLCTNANDGIIRPSDSSNGGNILTNVSDLSATAVATRLSDSTNTIWEAYGERTIREVPGDALSITSPTDSTSTPLGSGTAGAGSGCRFSSSGAAAWTVSETGAVDGMRWCCTNTGSNNITMVSSSGVYEGPGSVIKQWQQVCFEYVTDRFVERSPETGPYPLAQMRTTDYTNDSATETEINGVNLPIGTFICTATGFASIALGGTDGLRISADYTGLTGTPMSTGLLYDNSAVAGTVAAACQTGVSTCTLTNTLFVAGFYNFDLAVTVTVAGTLRIMGRKDTDATAEVLTVQNNANISCREVL